MKIALLSDLHVELHDSIPDINPDADIIVLAGDIHDSGQAGEVAEEYRNQYGKPVILVAGNHDHFGADLLETNETLRDTYDGSKGVWFLEKGEVVIDGVRFLGCTLWTNFELLGPTHAAFAMAGAAQILGDFTQIQLGDDFMTVADMISLHAESVDWLEASLMAPSEDCRKTVVISHFGPHDAAVHPRYRGTQAGAMTPYFVSDCSRLMRRYPIDVWMFGHTHNSIDCIVEGGTRLVANQRGYVGEGPERTGFDAFKLVEVS